MARNSLLRHSDKLAFSDYKLLKAHTSALPILTHTHPCLKPPFNESEIHFLKISFSPFLLSLFLSFSLSRSLSLSFFILTTFPFLSLHFPSSFPLFFYHFLKISHSFLFSLSLSTSLSLLLSLSQNLSFFLSHYLYISFSHSFLLLSSFFILTFPLLFLSLHLPFFFLFLTLFNFLAEKLSTKNEKWKLKLNFNSRASNFWQKCFPTNSAPFATFGHFKSTFALVNCLLQERNNNVVVASTSWLYSCVVAASNSSVFYQSHLGFDPQQHRRK